MTAIVAELQERVDFQLLEQAAFAPLDLLLDSGRLLHCAYENWRRGEIGFLDDVLMGSGEKIKAQLEAAAAYARGIGLVEQPQVFHSWNSGAADRGDEPLRISADPQLHRLIACRYIPAQNAPQMDLFIDNPVVALTNGLLRALAAGSVVDARRQLDRLYAHAPNHTALAAFDRLLDTLSHLGRPIDDIRQELAFLFEITPSARRLLGSQARDLLAPLWRQLADAIGARPFSGDEPDLHRSFALCQSQDWPAVELSVRNESAWWLHAPLCLRLAQSCFHRRRRAEALTAWFHLCWRHPAQAAEGLGNLRQPDSGVTALWLQFIDSEDPEPCAADQGCSMSVMDFPAWLLLHEPGLHLQLAADLAMGGTPAEENYRCVHRWLQARRANQRGEEIALRRILQTNHPVLFGHLKGSVAGR